jgi:hypothetical protein
VEDVPVARPGRRCGEGQREEDEWGQTSAFHTVSLTNV